MLHTRLRTKLHIILHIILRTKLHTLRCLLAVPLISLAASAPAYGQSRGSDVPLVVSTQWLADHASDPRLVIIDAGYQSRASYDSAHIRGAQYLQYNEYVLRRNGLTSEIPPVATLDSLLESVGISNNSRIVIYGSPIISHRLFLALDVMGLRGQVGMLDGGLGVWRNEQRPIDSGPPPKAKPGKLNLKPRSDVLVDRAWVSAHLNDAKVQFVDARQKRNFDAGHLQGAASVEANLLAARVAGNRTSWSYLGADSLQHIFTTGGVLPKRQLVAYCAIGETASVVYFTSRALGLPVKFYDGSLEDWGTEPAGPLVRSP